MARPANDMLVVSTADGEVRGADLEGLQVWRGIPYARPPVGPLRFAAPQAPESWRGVRQAVEPAPVAWQSLAVNMVTGEQAELDRDEDCLYLNVTAPADPSPDVAGYPVLIWVHGGGYVQGAGAGDLVGDAAGLSRRGLVVVTFNYRLGALGFLHLGDLTGAEFISSGHAGLLDQVAALRWVHANISGFGGDPQRITLYGVSAGAKSIANLMASPLTAGLISRAISASGGGEHVANHEQATRVRHRLLRELGIDDDRIALLTQVPAAEFVLAQEAIATGPAGTWVWRPVLGDPALPAPPVRAIASGAAAGIPMLIGSNGNEGATYQLVDRTAAEQAPRVLAELFGQASADNMLAAYASARPELDETGIWLAVLGAERYGIPTYRLARAQSAHAPVWRYRFDGCPPGAPAELAGGHGLDMFAVWSADEFAGAAWNGHAEAQLCLAMADAWARFSRGGSPSALSAKRSDDRAPELPRWDEFGAGDELTMILDASPRLEPGPRQAELDIWESRVWQSGTWWHFDGM